MTTMQEIQSELFRLYQGGQFREALDLMEREMPRFPEAETEYLFFRASLASLVGDTAEALAVLGRALDLGQWFHELRLRHRELAALQGIPEFERIAAVCKERHAAAEAEARLNPVRLCHVPEPMRRPSPLLVALHGSTLPAAVQAPVWEPAAAEGWLTVLPQSGQLLGPGAPIWADYERAAADVDRHCREVCEEYAVDTNRVVLAGFSAGASLALRLALDGRCGARGVVMVCPGTVHEEQLRASLERGTASGLRAWLVLGRKDPYYAHGQTVMRVLHEHGVPLAVEEVDGLGHQFPGHFPAVLKNWLQEW